MPGKHKAKKMLKLLKSLKQSTTKRRTLNWHNKGIKGSEAKELATILSEQGTQITKIRLSYNEIKSGAAALGSVPQISYLDLSANHIKDDDIIAGKFAQHSALHTLILADNSIGDDAAATFGDASEPVLEVLDLSDNEITGSGAKKIIGHNSVLRSLSLARNKLDDATEEVAESFAASKSLEELNLSSTGLSNNVIKCFINSQLLKLSLAQNKIDDPTAREFAENHQLLSLDLSFNRNELEDGILRADYIPIGDEAAKAFAKNKILSELDLSGNNLSGEGVAAFADNTTLTSLCLTYNPPVCDDWIAPGENIIVGANITKTDKWQYKHGAEKLDGVTRLTANKTLLALQVWTNELTEPLVDRMLVRNRMNAAKFLKACQSGKMTIVNKMLDAQEVSPYATERTYTLFLPNPKDSCNTGLHFAVLNNQPELALELVTRFPQLLKMRNNQDKTPEMMAEESGNKEILAILRGEITTLTAKKRRKSSLASLVSFDFFTKKRRDTPTLPLAPASAQIAEQRPSLPAFAEEDDMYQKRLALPTKST